ncbi:hypothetical protein ACFQ08_19680 [Streptosporangium algeriense]|uniref:Uncharacterized protein n=1 Tax=Streptosporangium algeriense TaxID=1682748 RepID=A0ABW3DSJ4_9ACTN
MVRAAPHPGLRPGVMSYRGFRTDAGRLHRSLEIPVGVVSLLLGLGKPFRVLGSSRDPRGACSSTALLCGLQDRSFVGERDGRSAGVEVVMTPWAAFTLFGVPMKELAGSVTPVEDLPDPEFGELNADLCAIRSTGG